VAKKKKAVKKKKKKAVKKKAVKKKAVKKKAVKKKAVKKKAAKKKQSIGKGKKLYRDFKWGQNPKSITSRKSPDFSVLVHLGDASMLDYATKKGKRRIATYRHKFKLERTPKVYATADRKAIVIMGGGLKVTDRGIEG